jgi:O-antigen/teichoic acid export membrane protein
VPAGFTPSIKNKILAGAVWMVAIKWSFRLFGLASTMVLARLLTPEDFGIVAIAMALIGILDAFFDFGFDLALIKNQNATHKDYDAAWTLRVANMALFGLSIALLSPLMAAYSSSPETITISLVLALSIAIRGLTNIGTVDFQKDLEFSSVFKLQVLSKMLATGTTITLAFLLRSYWAIIISFLTSSIYSVSFSYLLSPYRPRLRFNGIGKIWSFSKWVLLTNMARQLFISLDKFLLSGLVNKAQLGYYNVSSSLASIVTIELLSPIGSVLMPGFAKLQNDHERLRVAFIKSLAVLLAIILPAGVGVWLTAPELVNVILGNQWHDAAGLVALFGILAIFASLSETLSNFMAMTNLIAESAWIGIARTSFFLLGFYFAFQAGGLEGVILFKTALALVEVFILFQISARFLNLPATSFLRITWRPALAVITMGLTLYMLAPWLTGNAYIDLLAKALAGATAYVASSLLMWKMVGKPDGLESLALDLIFNKFAGRLRSTAQ